MEVCDIALKYTYQTTAFYHHLCPLSQWLIEHNVNSGSVLISPSFVNTLGHQSHLKISRVPAAVRKSISVSVCWLENNKLSVKSVIQGWELTANNLCRLCEMCVFDPKWTWIRQYHEISLNHWKKKSWISVQNVQILLIGTCSWILKLCVWHRRSRQFCKWRTML